MALSKRKCDIEEKIASKTLKLKNDFIIEDSIFSIDSINEDIRMSLLYDYTLNIFIVSITKQKSGEGDIKHVAVEEKDMYVLKNRFLTIQCIINKYKKSPPPNPLDIDIELSELAEKEYGTVAFVKENSFRRGVFSGCTEVL